MLPFSIWLLNNPLAHWWYGRKKDRDPFYSEENVKMLREAKEQLERGEGIEFDINQTGR